jgi:hypothetical protein
MRAAIQAIFAKGFEHAHHLYFKPQCRTVVNIVLTNLKDFFRFSVAMFASRS